jgi:hypothetical protein
LSDLLSHVKKCFFNPKMLGLTDRTNQTHSANHVKNFLTYKSNLPLSIQLSLCPLKFLQHTSPCLTPAADLSIFHLCSGTHKIDACRVALDLECPEIFASKTRILLSRFLRPRCDDLWRLGSCENVGKMWAVFGRLFVRIWLK